VEHLGGEPHTRGLVWVAVAEGYPQAVDATLPRSVLWPHDRRCPHIHVVLREWGGAAALGRVALNGFQVAHKAQAAGWHGAGHCSYYDELLITGHDQGRCAGCCGAPLTQEDLGKLLRCTD
jgi:hypothetical protein